MRRRPGFWQTVREAGLAVFLCCAIVLVGANFVLVEVRFLGVAFDARLGWVILAALLLGFGAGVLWMRRPGGR